MIQEDYEKLVEHIAGINNDYKIVVEDVDLDSYDDKPKEKNSRQEIRDAIKPIAFPFLPLCDYTYHSFLTIDKKPSALTVDFYVQ